MTDPAHTARVERHLRSAGALQPAGGLDIQVRSVRLVRGDWDRLELEIAYALAPLPDGVARIPATDDPETVAVELHNWAMAHHDHHRPPAPVVMDPDSAWDDLLRNLGYHGSVREAGDGRVEVTERDGDVFTVLVTREQWARVWAHEGDDMFHDLLGPRAEDETFVVFHQDDLVRSVREELPPVASTIGWELAANMRRRYEEAIARDPDAQVGWFAYPPDSTGD